MKKKDFALGILCGAMLFSGAAAAAAGITAEPTWQNIYVDEEQVSMTAYNIAGNNYVRLRDIGQQVGFNVYWQNGVQIDTDAPYTGVAPVQEAEELPTILNRHMRVVMTLMGTFVAFVDRCQIWQIIFVGLQIPIQRTPITSQILTLNRC